MGESIYRRRGKKQPPTPVLTKFVNPYDEVHLFKVAQKKTTSQKASDILFWKDVLLLQFKCWNIHTDTEDRNETILIHSPRKLVNDLFFCDFIIFIHVNFQKNLSADGSPLSSSSKVLKSNVLLHKVSSTLFVYYIINSFLEKKYCLTIKNKCTKALDTMKGAHYCNLTLCV